MVLYLIKHQLTPSPHFTDEESTFPGGQSQQVVEPGLEPQPWGPKPSCWEAWLPNTQLVESAWSCASWPPVVSETASYPSWPIFSSCSARQPACPVRPQPATPEWAAALWELLSWPPCSSLRFVLRSALSVWHPSPTYHCYQWLPPLPPSLSGENSGQKRRALEIFRLFCWILDPESLLAGSAALLLLLPGSQLGHPLLESML